MTSKLNAANIASGTFIPGSNVTITHLSGGITIAAALSGSGAPTDAQYVTLAANGNLSAERVLTPGVGLGASDAGAGGAYTLGLNLTGSGNVSVTTGSGNSIVISGSGGAGTTYDAGDGLSLVGTTFAVDGTVPRVSGSHFTGGITTTSTGSFELGISGSLTRLTDGRSAIVAGSNVTVASSSNGQVTISSTDTDTTYSAGSGLALAGTTFAVDGTVVRVSGSHITGNISVAGTGSFATGISGSLTRLTDGTSFIAAGDNITVMSSSNGQIVITGQAGGSGVGDPNATYLVISNTGSLNAERAIAMGSGLSSADAGANSTYTISVDGTVARVSGTHFTGNISSAGTGSFALGISGSHTRLVSGLSAFAGQGNVVITSSSNGQVVVSSSNVMQGDLHALFVVDPGASVPNRRVISADQGMRAVDGGAGGSYSLQVDDAQVMFVSGGNFQGAVTNDSTFSADLGFSGSLTRLTDGTSYLAAGPNVTITSSSNGQVTISAATGTAGSSDSAAAYVVLNATSSLSNERVLTGTNGLTLTDGGAGNAVTLQLDGTVARVSGSRFQGNITVTGTGSFELGMSGSLTRLTDGTSFIRAGSNVTVTSSSNGGITIASTATGGSSLPVLQWPMNAATTISGSAFLEVRNRHLVAAFTSTLDRSILFEGVMPPGYAGGNLDLTLYWLASGSATTGDVVWAACFERHADDAFDLDGDNFAAPLHVTASAPSVNGELSYDTLTFTQAQAASIAAGESFRGRITRSGSTGADTMIPDAQLFKILLEEV